ncbi:MAG: hypothetical protein KF905_05410 [Flavobacteriales bacterium]|nr:hypothetical protein [Flavobacteriales bacterium]
MDWRRWISWFRPISAERTEGLFGTLDVRWELGRKVLNTANANQSFGSLHNVWAAVLQHLNLPQKPPRSVLLLGLGGGSAVHILRSELKLACPITAVELDPAMIDLGKRHFGLGHWADVNIVQGDATIQVHALRERYDLVLVDLFDDLDLARGVDHGGFMHGLRDRCEFGGTLCFNTVSHDEFSEGRCDRVKNLLQRVFSEVEEFRTKETNSVFIAR